MRFSTLRLLSALAVVVGLGRSSIRADAVDDLLAQARAKLTRGQHKEALALADQAIELKPKNIKGYVFRGALYEFLNKHKESLADYDKVIALSPKTAEGYNQRGAVHFKMGHIKQSIADFDKYIALKPKEKNGHWMRGISLYYAGRFEDGAKQFKGYEDVSTNDVENAVWHFLCVARSRGVARARKAMLKIGKDPRVPMMEVYALYAGKAKPADVLKAAQTVAKGARPEVRKLQLFYAHLYLGLYYEVTGDKKRALEHMTRAARDSAVAGYMGDVARIHLRFMKKST